MKFSFKNDNSGQVLLEVPTCVCSRPVRDIQYSTTDTAEELVAVDVGEAAGVEWARGPAASPRGSVSRSAACLPTGHQYQ